MIELITTVETIKQAEQLLAAGADTLYFGEEQFGLRLPASFTREEQRQLVELAHKHGKKANIAVNGIIHPEKMKNVPEYLAFLKEINVDVITVGDTGIIYTMKKNPELRIPYIYDAETLVTSARQINFWAKKGAVGAVLAREVPFEEMKAMEEKLHIGVPGHGIVIAVPIKSVGGGNTVAYLNGGRSPKYTPDLSCAYELIIAIANEGGTDAVMNAARAAGARGGTVLHGKGTGAKGAPKFYNISIAAEKEVILIVSAAGQKAEIMRSILRKAGPDSDAGAIVFSLPASAVAGFGLLEEN